LERLIDQYDFFEDLFENHQTDLVIGGSKIVADICRKMGILQRYLAPYKYKSYAYWGVNEFWESNIFQKTYNMSEPSDEVFDSTDPTTYEDVLKTIKNKNSLKFTIKNFFYIIVRRLYWKIRGYEKAKGYFLKDELAYTLRRWWRLRNIQKYSEISLKTLSDKDFLFFPLHLEPERATTTFSPEFFDQMFAIQNISKELPAGRFLVIKEHLLSIPVRPKHFYKQLKEIHNVLIANPIEKSFEYIKNSKGVVALTGTAGFEAAMMGIPVISFGQHNLYNILPHVHVVRSWGDVSKIVNKVFLADKRRIREGRRFIDAFIKISAKVGKDCNKNRVAIYKELEKSLLMTIK
jgi:hypothetical protein